MCGRKKEDGNRKIIRKHRPEMAQIAETWAGFAKYCFRLLPPASVSFRGRLAAVVSLVSDIHLIDGVGKLGDGG